jgi:hypothetical protein
LPSGKSFNNRIYFIDVSQQDRHAAEGRDADVTETTQKQSLVLKVSGQFFGPDKVQNEISCLMLLERHCPDVPVPRVIAWSEDGLEIRRLRQSTATGKHKPVPVHESPHPTGSETGGRGWVLMTRRPGRLIGAEDLQSPQGASVMQQLAGYTAQWRQRMPKADRIGNIKQVPDVAGVQGDDIYQSFEDHSLKFTIEGLLFCHYVPPGAITCSLDYYRIKLEDQLTKLETEDVFSVARHQVSPHVRESVRSSLPGLSLFSRDKSTAFAFTHYDFSPRNILISGSSPPVVTGILDFEFAGFFPNEEEFTNNAIANADDWPEPAYRVFLEELERLGVKTPLRGIDQKSWVDAYGLVHIMGDVAPWYLREGGTNGPGIGGGTEKSRRAS